MTWEQRANPTSTADGGPRASATHRSTWPHVPHLEVGAGYGTARFPAPSLEPQSHPEEGGVRLGPTEGWEGGVGRDFGGHLLRRGQGWGHQAGDTRQG